MQTTATSVSDLVSKLNSYRLIILTSLERRVCTIMQHLVKSQLWDLQSDEFAIAGVLLGK